MYIFCSKIDPRSSGGFIFLVCFLFISVHHRREFPLEEESPLGETCFSVCATGLLDLLIFDGHAEHVARGLDPCF